MDWIRRWEKSLRVLSGGFALLLVPVSLYVWFDLHRAAVWAGLMMTTAVVDLGFAVRGLRDVPARLASPVAIAVAVLHVIQLPLLLIVLFTFYVAVALITNGKIPH